MPDPTRAALTVPLPVPPAKFKTAEAPMRVLVVDDDITVRILMRAALRQADCEVGLASGGEEALRLFREQHWDLVMLDVEMPDLSGYEVCARLRVEAGELLPIVMVTGMDDVASVERAYESGATDFIAKPINRALIGHRVKYLLRGTQALHDLQGAIARNAAILQALPDPLLELALDGTIVNFHASRQSGSLVTAPEAWVGKHLADVYPPNAVKAFRRALDEAHSSGAAVGQQFELVRPEGKQWFELSVAPKHVASGQAAHFVVLSRDITERKEAEQRILRLAHFDSLTGLPNRQSFVDRVNREIQRARHAGGRLALLFMDLDGFKNVNDSMGHAAGDDILRSVSDRLCESMRPSDVVTRRQSCDADGGGAEVEVARLGGDEFTALVLDLQHPEDALCVARRVLGLVEQPFLVQGREVSLSTSVGIAVFPDDGQDAVTLLKHADTAMYQAKASGRGRCEFYSAELTERAVHRMAIETSLRLALERQEFHLVYQPQLQVATGRIESVEALIRWNHPLLGLVSPLEFIPLAEENGLIVPIGQWILETACADAVRWQRPGQPLRLAVNLSPLQFKDPGLVQAVIDTCARNGLGTDLLELEITEGAVLSDTKATMATLEAFRDIGVRIALDDFGTGYSSLSYLKRMTLSNLKIDRSFVTGLPGDLENGAIVRAILAMAESLGIAVVAEGVETIEQANALKAMACNALQGFLFSKPVLASQIPALLDRCWLLDPATGAPNLADVLAWTAPIPAAEQRVMLT